MTSLLNPPFSERNGDAVYWRRLHGCAPALAVSSFAQQHEQIIVVTESTASLHTTLIELDFFKGSTPLFEFPDWECLPYDRVSPHQDITSKRLATLAKLAAGEPGIYVMPIAALMQRLPPSAYVAANSFDLRVDQEIDTEALRTQLINGGYYAVEQVMAAGEYAFRGGVVDVFPSGAEMPFRLDLFDTVIESIRHFDPETQRSTTQLSAIELLPAREYPLDEAGVQHFRQAFRASFDGDPKKASIYNAVSDGFAAPGIEFYIPLFFESLATLFDYCSDEAKFVFLGNALESVDDLYQEAVKRFENAQFATDWPPLEPPKLFLANDELRNLLNNHPRAHASLLTLNEPKHAFEFKVSAPPGFNLNLRSDSPYSDLINRLESTNLRTLIVAESAGRRESLIGILNQHRLKPQIVDSWAEFAFHTANLGMIVGDLDRGATLDELNIQIVTEAELYGRQASVKRHRSERNKDPDAIIKSLAELKIGDPIVHEDHGVGRYRGLEALTIDNDDNEFAVVEYQGGDRIYIPVLSLSKVSRYVGGTPESAPLHKMGSDTWIKLTRKAREKAYDIAAELLEVQALRAARVGHAFPSIDESYSAFAAGFGFEETADQMQVIDDVIDDMVAPKPMDRLVCGDVGFGKTEIALRAAYMAIAGGKQVAVLVPTTLLAQQHFDNFADRFADWPVRIELFSRFRSGKQTTQAIEGLAAGTIDIAVGTHKLIQKDVKFKDLGLLIIDEEHRFGVRQKEQLKKLRSQVDILTLTATPIPRTLNFALSGLRDISVIATPPKARLSVKTFVREWNDQTLKEAITREIRRGGQVYFLHNEVQTIEKTREVLEQLVPEARIRIGHGQMGERELETVMRDFYHQRFNVLLCTTIIESGIDVPSANTIVINRADRFGLAQLHQLRGRVGRSHHQAYAYMITPPLNVITSDARKRLEAIEALNTLGAGFALASQDLEIRGAGELLGESQSGVIDQIGYSMYSTFLEQAIQTIERERRRKKGQPALPTDASEPMLDNVEINLNIAARFPDAYVPDVHVRLTMYKRIASARNKTQLEELELECIDRFGLLPEAATNLFKIASLKLSAAQLGISAIDAGPKGALIKFVPEPAINFDRLLQVVSQHPSLYRFSGAQNLSVTKELETGSDRFKVINDFLSNFEDDN